jgi:integrase
MAYMATTLVALRIDPKTAQVRQGHAHIWTTLDIYARQSPAADRIAADAIGDHFRPPLLATSS